MRKKKHSIFSSLLALGATGLLSGCNMTLLDPKGPVSLEAKHLILTAFGLMLIVVIPVIVMAILFSIKYRASNKDADYAPNWAHSTKIEVIVWGVPLVIVAILAVLIWKTSHSLDPFRPIDSDVKPITIEAIAVDWKWVFIYPEQGIATINEIAFPVDTPVNFRITSDTVMNTLFIPALGSMVYAMGGMQTQLHLLAHEAGDFGGGSANYSGAGFSDMKFVAHATSAQDFTAWVEKVKTSPKTLDTQAYADVAQPSEKHPIEHYSSVTPNLFQNVIDKYLKGDYSKRVDQVMDQAMNKSAHQGAAE
jgi:cytochrome o ubiquinol oxidase subunit 2